MSDQPSLIVTLALEKSAMQLFETLRRRYFPPERNIVPAHVCLFHALPGSKSEAATRATLATVTREFAQVRIDVLGPRSIGRGVALFLDYRPLHDLYQAYSQAFQGVLTAQDRQGFRPHVTVHNKSTADEARRVLAEIADQDIPRSVEALGITLWRYLGGPWQELETIPFARTLLQ